MHNWAVSLLDQSNEDADEITLFMLLRHIDSVDDYLLSSVESLSLNQFFSTSAVRQIRQLHQLLWKEKYQVSDIEYQVIISLMDKKVVSLADMTAFLKEKGLSTSLIAGWMNTLIRKLHQDGKFFIDTRTHPSGTEYHWNPILENSHG